MKRIRSSYHTLHVLKAADPKLRKAVIANCNQETLKSIWECAFNVLLGNIPMSACRKRELRNIRTVSARSRIRGYIRQAESYKAARRFPSPAAVCYITHSRRTFIQLALTMLHKMYLFSSELFQKLPATNKLPSNIRRGRILLQSDYDKWIKIRERLREKNVTRNAQIKDIAKFKKQFLPEPPVQRFEPRDRITPPSVQVKLRRVVESLPFAEAEITRENQNSKLTKKVP
jgi:hypothetical protein